MEIAELRNGFTIRHRLAEMHDGLVRLYMDEQKKSFVDVPAGEIESYSTSPIRSGAVNGNIAAATLSSATPAKSTSQIVREASEKHGVDSDFIRSVIRQESAGNAHAVSPAGARGLMQLMPGTASQLGVNDSFSPEQNVHGGARYLRELLERYNGDAIKALAAYNAGPERWTAINGVPPYRETQLYVQRVVRDYNKKKRTHPEIAVTGKQHVRFAEQECITQGNQANRFASERQPANSGSGSLSLMKKKQIISLVVVAAILGALVYFQFRSWRTFDWAKFRQYTGGVSLWHIGAGVALIYLAYVLRAIRWAIFLKPTAPTSFRRLIAPQIIGFAALGLFGRAGEFARPYLIARKEKLTFTSQLAVWTVERFFDLGSVLVLMVGFFALKGGALAQVLLQALHHGLHAAAQNAGHKLPLALAALAVLALLFFVLQAGLGTARRQRCARACSPSSKASTPFTAPVVRAIGRGLDVPCG